MVYAALFGAIAMQNVGLGMTYMVLYGLGTVPMMSLIVYTSGLLSMPMRNKLQKIIPVVMVFLGMLFIVRGLGLGIPFLSPTDVSLFVQAAPDCH